MSENVSLQFQIAVCDDEPSDCQRNAALVREILQKKGISCMVSLYFNGSELLEAISHGAKFEIILLDVMMDGLDGMELAAVLRRLGENTAIIFISVNREMAMRGYEVAAVRYLEKPVQIELLQEALLFCYKTFYQKKEILLPTGKGQSRIFFSDIMYAEAAERVTKLFLTDRQEKINLKFSDLAALLPKQQFILCHRSYLVNLEYIKYIRSRELELTVGYVLPVSKYRLNDLQKKFVDYLSD